MSVYAGAAIYLIIWWLVLFAVLPFGVRSQIEDGNVVQGSEGGAPAQPHLKAKVLATTLLATAIFAAFYVVYTRELLLLDVFGFIPKI